MKWQISGDAGPVDLGAGWAGLHAGIDASVEG